VLLGIVQGVSEWLPISSKTQIIFLSSLLLPQLTLNQAYDLGLFLEAGTFIAAVIYFRVQVLMVLKTLIGRGTEEGWLLLRFLVVVTSITAVIGVAIFKLVSEAASGEGPALGVPMLALGCVLIGDSLLIAYARGKYIPRKGLKDLRLREMVIVGIAQGIAALPGVSRSGATVSVMLLVGIKPEDSFRLSFLALIPAAVGASAVTVLLPGADLSGVISTITAPVLLLAILVSIVVGIVFIRVLLKAAASKNIVLLTFGLGVLAIFSGVSTFLVGHG